MFRARFRRHEIGGAAGIQDVFARAVAALFVIGVDERDRRIALHNERGFPAQIVGVVDAT